MRFLKNPKKKGRRTRRKLYGAAAKAHAKKRAKSGRKSKRRTTAKRAVRSHVSKGKTMAKRRRKRRSTAVVRHRRRSFRHNPRKGGARRRRRGGFGGTAKGLLGMAVQGAKDAAAVVLGKAASRAIPATLGLNLSGPMGIAAQAASGLVAGYAASRFLGQRVASFVIAGAFAAPIESLVRSLNIPIISGALGDYAFSAMDAPDSIGAYAPGDLAAYALAGAEDADDMMYTA